jgi:dimethylhistidine N-methyltransferase
MRHRLATERGTLAAEVLIGLRERPKRLPPKLFYDLRGAELFEEICRQPEYYLWRAELEILTDYRNLIAELAGPRVILIDLGSGAGDKSRLLLSGLESPAAYVPVDVTGDQLDALADRVETAYPDVEVRPVRADYTRPFILPSLPPNARRVAYFHGSTVGNFHEIEAIVFLDRLRRMVGPRGNILLGADRMKDRATLEAAYNDARGVTAAFNMNLLSRLNRELGADFDLAAFRHSAFFNDEACRIEMHLESLAEQTVDVAGATIGFDLRETIWTESSYKYDLARLERLTASSGLEIGRLVGALTSASTLSQPARQLASCAPPARPPRSRLASPERIAEAITKAAPLSARSDSRVPAGTSSAACDLAHSGRGP